MHAKADDLQWYLARARERFGDRLLTWLTLLLVVLTFVIVPLHAVGLIVTQGYVFAIVLVMASCIVGAPAGVGAVIAMLFGLALAVAAVVARLSSLSSFEAIIGQLYPATLLARLVTLDLQDRRR
jgi:hypothetical protein